MEKAAKEADALILAGDIFDAWIGDDIALKDPDPWLRETLSTLQRVANRIPLWLGRGNRDFLLGHRLAHHVGARLLPEPALLETCAGAILLAHGDEYCTADRGYQRFRRLVRHPGIQRAYLALPLPLRKRIAAWARARSMSANRYKALDIMDVEPDAIANALRQSQAHTLIHGHTHRPARHSVTVDGRSCERLVLPDWDFDHAQASRGGWIGIDEDGVSLFEMRPASEAPASSAQSAHEAPPTAQASK